ncbi:MAG: hypothetical protein AAFZ74_05230 [Pseudomonadota bacterium]
MMKSLFKFLSKPKSGKEMLTELDVSRVTGETTAASDQADADADATQADIEVWKQNDLDLLQTTWQTCYNNPECEDSATAFRNALHNLHGASGAYGGGALTRLSGSLHVLVSGVEELQTDAALINLHVQACRATSLSDGEAADDVADVVCDALEKQVSQRLKAEAA